MGKIKELSTILTNQIAAGEVIERPASVVKELVENAIDANSTRIEIRVEEAGLKKIQISDNGEGMTREDAEMAIRRHTTSKLYTQEDLFRIRTLGFRGEALASITAVAKVTLETSTGEGVGTRLIVEAGQIKERQDIAPIKGTTITVENLFFNTPARLKFVRTLQTELSHITDMISRISLSHPEIAFILYHEGQELIRTNGTDDLRQAIAGNIGTTSARKMIAFKGENLDFSVSGYTSLPELTRSNRNYLFVYINGRAVRNIVVNKAIVAGYGSSLMIGRFPVTVLSIQMDHLLVDVNVHPTKQEVRISKEAELAQLITESIRQAIQQTQRIPTIEANAQEHFKRHNFKQVQPMVQQQLPLRSQTSESWSSREKMHEKEQDEKAKDHANELENIVTTQGDLFTNSVRKKSAIEEDAASIVDYQTQSQDEQLSDHASAKIVQSVGDPHGIVQSNQHHSGTNYIAMAHEQLKKEVTSVPQEFPELYYFGQMHGTYLFAQNEKGLYMIDQHAAQERIKYEQYRVEIGEVEVQLQELLVPIVFDFTQQEVIRLQEKQSELEALGIFLEPFGQQSFQLQAHPTWIKRGEEKATIEEMIDFVLRDEKITLATLREATAIMMSCKRSIKANHHLSDQQARQLLSDLARCKNPYNCPHGRPVLVHFANYEIERFFKRIQDTHATKTKQLNEE